MKLSAYIRPEQILFIDKTDKAEILKEMAAKASEMNLVTNLDEFTKALLERETLISTGIGLGIAIPHTKIHSIPDFFVMVGMPTEPVNWDSIDSLPVQTVFLIGGPDGQQKKYLQILSKLSLLIKNDQRREQLFSATSKEDIAAMFTHL